MSSFEIENIAPASSSSPVNCHPADTFLPDVECAPVSMPGTVIPNGDHPAQGLPQVPEIPKFAAALDAVLQKALTSCIGPPALASTFGCSSSCNSAPNNTDQVSFQPAVDIGTQYGSLPKGPPSSGPEGVDLFNIPSSVPSNSGRVMSWLLTTLFGSGKNSETDESSQIMERMGETESLTGQDSSWGQFCSHYGDSRDTSTMEALITSERQSGFSAYVPGYSRLLQVQTARRLRDTKDFYNALQHYKKALDAPAELDPNSDTMLSDSFVYLELGQVLYDAGKPQEAIAAFNKGIELSPVPDSSLYYRKGVVHSSLGQYDDALDAFHQILAESDPREVSALFQSAVVEQKRQRYSAALKFTERVLEVQPDHFEADLMCIECLHALGKDVEASERLQKLTRAYPRRAASLSRLLLTPSP